MRDFTRADWRVTFEPLADYRHLAAPWRRLEGRGARSFFQSWLWMGTWLGVLPPVLEPFVAAVYRGPRLVGLAVWVRCPLRRHGWLHSDSLWLAETGQPVLDRLTVEYNGPLTEPGLEAPVLRMLLGALCRLDGRWDECYMSNAAPLQTTTYRAVAGACGLQSRVVAQAPCYWVDLCQLRRDRMGHLEVLSGNTRYQVRQSLGAYRAVGPLTVDVPRDLAEAKAFFARLVVLHRRHWRSRGRPGAFATSFAWQFHQRLLDAAWPHGVQVLKFSAGAEVIGYLYNFHWSGRVFNYQSGFHYVDDPKKRPGLVCHTLAIDYYLQRQADCYDFMAGYGRHKASLATHSATMSSLVFQRPRWKLGIEDRLRRLKGQWLALRTPVSPREESPRTVLTIAGGDEGLR
ncbi:MAG: GNAT family N-acetyltransferase [Candidatus Competibacterales bacterium]